MNPCCLQTDAIASNMRNKMRTHMGANGSPLFTRGEKREGDKDKVRAKKEREDIQVKIK